MGHFCEKYLPIIFDNDGSRGTNQFFETDYNEATSILKREAELEENSKLALEVLHTSFMNIDKYLSKYSIYQLANGLEYIFNPSFGNIGFLFENRGLNQKKQIETLDALGDLMLYIHEEKAEPVLGHLDQKPKNKQNNILNYSCYMFWETACIPHICDREGIDACLRVMAKCAQSHNVAVVEGALHGLGHAQSAYGYPIIQEYIQKANFGNSSLSSALRRYAEAAKTGSIL